MNKAKQRVSKIASESIRLGRRAAYPVWLLTLGLTKGVAGETNVNSGILANLSFDQLSQIEVTTASKRPEKLDRIPAAVSVLTGEDIKRLGVTTLPDALRYVPGIDVDMISSSSFGVSSRGFGGEYANQLLVLRDGRSIYDPSFGGVSWPAQDTMLDDVERIEVVRGPGGTLWGANAVNGVINILSKPAKDTQGTLVTAGGGNFNQAITAGRYGFKLADQTYARVYAKFDQFGRTPLESGGETHDDWWRAQAGFRMDSERSESSTFTLQGDVNRVENSLTYPFPSFTAPGYSTLERYRNEVMGANLLGRWTRHFSEDSTLAATVYADSLDDNGQVAHQRIETVDADLLHNFNWGGRNQITWGMGYRVVRDEIFPSRVENTPARQQANDQLFNLFGQDQIALVVERLFLTLGTKLEHNHYTGWEVSPTARLLWKPVERQSVWAAVSRAVATPTHLSTAGTYDLSILPPGTFKDDAPGTLVQIQGKSDHVEELVAYEVGYRIQPTASTSVDIAAFYNNYSHLMVTEQGGLIPGTPGILPVYWVNRIDGHTHGVEVDLGWQALSHWRLRGSYTWFGSDVAQSSIGRGDGGSSPKHKVGVRSSVDFDTHWEWDAGLRYVSKLQSEDVAGYTELDTRISWKPTPNWEVALVGQSLLHSSHLESPRGTSPLVSEVPRSVYAKVTRRF